ncbi:MAG: iron-containing alcohol dehydrogenase, partial [Desulfobulbaceae bacterium]|nr:iron-containing alcohol dehydrogenase [Desulfobulbaceae bacterium]
MYDKIISLKSPNLILAGFGALEKMGEEAKNLDVKKALMVTDIGIQSSGIGAQVEKILRDSGVAVTVFDKVQSDPDIACCESCICEAKKGDYDLVVGVGGGSPMDIASIASLMTTNPGTVHDYFGVNLLKNPGIPTFLVATTSGTGAEVTPNAILTDPEAKLKKGIVSPYILPRAAIVDPILTVTMPPRVTSFTGMDALTHAIESYTSMNATPLTDM